MIVISDCGQFLLYLDWTVWCLCSAQQAPSPGRSARPAAEGGRVA